MKGGIPWHLSLMSPSILHLKVTPRILHYPQSIPLHANLGTRPCKGPSVALHITPGTKQLHWYTQFALFCSCSSSCSFASSWRTGKIVVCMRTSSSILLLHLRLPLHSCRVFTTLAYPLGGWVMCAQCTRCSSGDLQCCGDCPVRSPSSVHHHRSKHWTM